MAQFVGDVGEPGLARADALGPSHRLLHGGVAGMGMVAQRRQHQGLQPLKQSEARLGNFAHVGQVGHVAEAKAGDVHLAVFHRHAE